MDTMECARVTISHIRQKNKGPHPWYSADSDHAGPPLDFRTMN